MPAKTLSKPKPRAARLAPEKRRAQILDTAVRLIVAANSASVSLEQGAAAAGISKPLIYKYFPRREDLLKALMDREFSVLAGRGLNTIPRDIPIERVIRGTVESALHYYAERGPIVRLLSADPALAAQMRAGNRGSRRSTTDYFVKRFTEVFGVPQDVAIIAVTMVVNAPTVSMGSIRRRGIPTDRTIEVWSEFIIGGWTALEAKFRTKPTKK